MKNSFRLLVSLCTMQICREHFISRIYNSFRVTTGNDYLEYNSRKSPVNIHKVAGQGSLNILMKHFLYVSHNSSTSNIILETLFAWRLRRDKSLVDILPPSCEVNFHYRLLEMISETTNARSFSPSDTLMHAWMHVWWMMSGRNMWRKFLMCLKSINI